MCIPQNLFIQIQYPLHLPHDTRTSIVEYRDETSLFVVAIAGSVGSYVGAEFEGVVAILKLIEEKENVLVSV